MIIFKKLRDPNNEYDKTDLIIRTDNDSTVDELCQVFEEFLNAMGYSIKGHIEYVKEEKVD